MNDFNNIDLNINKVQADVASVTHTPRTDFSSFPITLDKLKELDFSESSLDELSKDLEKYYELLAIYLKGDSVELTNRLDEFKGLTEKLSRYHLTSSDFAHFRDSLIEIDNYITNFSEQELYGAEGIHTRLVASVTKLDEEVNKIIKDVENHYNNLESGDLGKIIPDGTINEKHLSKEMLVMFGSIDGTSGVYVDRTSGSEVVIPTTFSAKPMVIKINE